MPGRAATTWGWPGPWGGTKHSQELPREAQGIVLWLIRWQICQKRKPGPQGQMHWCHMRKVTATDTHS